MHYILGVGSEHNIVDEAARHLSRSFSQLT